MVKWCELNRDLDPGQIYYCWAGKMHTVKDHFTIINSTWLLTLRETPQGWKYQVYYGYVGKLPGDMRPYARYGLSPLFKITKGTRKGYLRPVEALREEEKEFAVAADREIPISTNEKGIFSACLADLEEGQEIPQTSDIVVPDFYLSRPSMAPYKTLFHVDSPAFQETKHKMRESFELLEEDDVTPFFAVDAGGGRVAYPWKYFYGQGVTVADMSQSGQWYSCSLEIAKQIQEKDYVRIKL